MQPIRTFNVSPSLPKQLEPLRKLAYNLHWDWNVETKDLFRRLDPDLWESSRHNPVLMLGTISQERLQEAAEDEGFLAQLERASRQLDDYLKKRLRNLRDSKYRQQKREINTLQTESGETIDPIAILPARPDIQPVLEIWDKTLAWVQTDADGNLRNTCFRNCSEVNCQALILRRFPPETAWNAIAQEFNLTPAEAKDLPKVYNRKCLPQLRQFAESQGYVEPQNNSSRRKQS